MLSYLNVLHEQQRILLQLINQDILVDNIQVSTWYKYLYDEIVFLQFQRLNLVCYRVSLGDFGFDIEPSRPDKRFQVIKMIKRKGYVIE